MKTLSDFWRKHYKIIIAAVMGILLILWAGAIYLSFHFESILKRELQSRIPPSLTVEFGSLDVSLLSRSITINQLSIQYSVDTLPGQCHALNLSEVSLKGIGILPLLTNHKLKIKKILLANGDLLVDQALVSEFNEMVNDQFSDKRDASITETSIQSLQIKNVNFVLRHQDQELCAYYQDANIDHIAINISSLFLKGKDIRYHIDGFVMQNAHYAVPGQMYSFFLRKLQYSKKELQADTLVIAPTYSKFEFAHQAGKQIDRMNLAVDQIRFDGFSIDQLADSILAVGSVKIINADFHSFRDKRMPFIKKDPVPMPGKLFKNLPIAIKIDSLVIENSTITYEEFPENGDDSGVVSFHQINSIALGLNNRPSDRDFIRLNVETNFMNAGILKAKFIFPLSDHDQYKAEGVLYNFDLPAINPALEPLAKIQIASGTMNSLSFNFNYDKVESNGKLTLNYENLKLTVLKEKESKTAIDKIKSFLLNVLFIKKDKDDNVKKDKRTGTIHFSRDDRRSVFNYWWKSIASGIKSSYNLDKLLPKKGS